MRTLYSVAIAFFAMCPRAQVIGIDDLGLDSGGSAFVFSGFAFFSGFSFQTQLHIYSAQALRERGVCGGARLTDLAILPTIGINGGSSGTWSAPQALLQLGHVAPGPLKPGDWATNLPQPHTLHGLASGSLTLPWSGGTFLSLPGVTGAGFVWDGVRDVGLLIGAPAVAPGAFWAASCSGSYHYSYSHSVPPSIGSTAVSPTWGALKVRMTFMPPVGCGTSDVLGSGCYSGSWSFYELFSNLSAFDLAGSATTAFALRCTPAATGYSVSQTSSAWYTPGGLRLRSLDSSFPMVSDSISGALNLPFVFPFPGGTTNVLHAASRGYLLLGPPLVTTSDPTPTAAELLSGPARLSPLWAAVDPASDGLGLRGVYFDIDPNNQAAYVTWRDCRDGRGTGTLPTSINVQCVLRSNGEFEFRYQNVTTDPALTGAAVVGWSPGGGAGTDPGSRDLSVAMPFATTGPDSFPLQLVGFAPGLGATWRLRFSPIPTLVPIGLLTFGTGALPGLDLAALGAPGCRAWSTSDITTISRPAIGGVVDIATTVPMNPQLLGVGFTAQAAAFTFRNPLGIVTSNGLQFTVGP